MPESRERKEKGMITHEDVGERLGDTGQALGTAESAGRSVNQLPQLMQM
jgi:hypothetical protein